ncbi:response regulator transcription factor [Paenibacillus ginsengihumi]|uniref:response regulator transcription factor n=1 Tax=Paenibacillus ginsengihumi TaxID=431596 RepID=UPI0003699ED0|nr:helix-turn-helix domain-containing protein [Paenibacillus ginsengihumi]
MDMHTIMVVDDEKWSRAALKHTLEKTGLPFRVVAEHANGLEALNGYKSKPVDLILADVRMPVMDGLTLADELQRLYGRSPLMIVSGYDDFQYARQALRSGVVDYLLKPVEADDLRQSLERWMAGKSQERAAELAEPPLEASTIERVVHFVRRKLPGEVTLGEAAKHVHLNPNYLSQLFKQKTGRTFLDFVVECRMEEAKRLLATTSLRVSEVAEQLGYSDLAYFSTSFKKHCGRTPSEYRKSVAE